MSIGTRFFLQHHLNSAHIYCRIRSFLPKEPALRIARIYERFVHPLIYKTAGVGSSGTFLLISVSDNKTNPTTSQ